MVQMSQSKYYLSRVFSFVCVCVKCTSIGNCIFYYLRMNARYKDFVHVRITTRFAIANTSLNETLQPTKV